MISSPGEQPMGEVRVRVRMTNAMDEGLARRGQLPPDQVRTVEIEAVVDTGAVRCVLPPHIADRLGLERTDRYVAEYADNRREEVDLTEPFILDIIGRRTVEEALILGDEVLIGQTALEKTDVLVDCQRQQVIPNPAHPDRPVSKVKWLGGGRVVR